MKFNNRLSASTFRYKAELAVVLACIVLIIAVALGAWLSYRSHSTAAHEFVLRQAEDVALVLQAHTRDTLRSADDVLQDVKRGLERDGLRADLTRIMAGHRSIADYLTVVSVADARGTLILSTLPLSPGVSIADLAHFRAHVERDSGELFINKPVLGRVSGKWSFHLSRRINRPDGAFGGVAIVAVDLSYWSRLLQEGNFGEASAIALVGQDGVARAVFGRDGNKAKSLLQADWASVVHAADAEAGHNRILIPKAGGPITGAWAYRKLAGFPLFIAVKADDGFLSTQLTAVRHRHVVGTVMIVALAVLSAIGLLFFYSRQRVQATETARLAAAWQQSEERFRSAFEQAAVGMGLRPIDRRDLPYERVNQTLCNFLGYTEEELLRTPALDLAPPEGDVLAQEYSERIKNGEMLAYERDRQYLRKDGTVVWAHVNLSIVKGIDGRPSHTLSVVQDISDRKRAELAVQQSEARYRRLFDANPLPVFIRDQESMAILAVNQAMVDKYGYSHEEFCGMTSLQLVSAVSREAFIRDATILPHNAGNRNHRIHVTRDGSEIEVEVTTRAFDFNGKAAKLVVINDVTAQVRSARAVLASEERLRTIADHIDEGLALFDKTDHLVFFNEGYRRSLAGINAEPRLGKSFESLVRARAQAQAAAGEIEDVEAAVEELMVSHRDPRPKTIERKRLGGGYHLIREARTAAGQTIMSFIDITDIKRREEALHSSEQRFRAMFEHAGIGITMRPAHDRHHPWEVVNDHFCEMTGYSRAELLCMSTADITAPEGQEGAIRDNRRVLQGELDRYGREKRIVRKDGSLLWVQISVAVLPDAQGRPNRLIATYQDIHARKLAEEKVRESEVWFRAMFNHAGIGISTRPAHDRHAPWFAVNDKLCEMTGCSREELLRMSTADITVPEEQDDAIRDNRSLLDGKIGSYTREKQLICKDGGRVWVALSVTMLPGVGGQPDRIIATYQDIDARKRAEEKVRESEGRLRAIIAAEPECVAMVAPDGRVLEINPAGLRMLEASSLDEVQRQPIHEYVARGYRRAFVDLHRRILTGKSGVLEFEAVGLTGKHLWMEIHATPLHDAAGNITALLGIARDVTERRGAREMLAAERNLLRAVIDNLPDRIRVSDENGRIILANAAWLKIRAPGYRDVTGMIIRELVPDELRAISESEHRDVLDTGRPTQPREVMTGTPANPHWHVTTKTPLQSSAGKVIGVISIGRDVTDFKRRSLEVEKLNADLEVRVAERTVQLTGANEELEAFAASVSHDLRAPLRHIDGMAAAVLEDYADKIDAAGQGYLKRIRSAAQRMAGLIEDLLRLSRLTRAELNVSEVDLSKMADDIAEELRRDNPARAATFQIAPALRTIADPGLLRSALVNLLQNAWKFTGKKEAALIEFGVTQHGGMSVYFVRDNGAGFDMAQADRLFGTFQRLHSEREFPGTGIGLATVRRIMRRHGGDIWAESVVGKGATFYFMLAVRPAENEVDVTAPDSVSRAMVSAVSPSDAGERTIVLLLVDDDPDVLTLSSRALRPDGYEVLTAGTGEEAMEILRNGAVNVIVSDYSMPGMHGAKLLAEAAARYPDTLRIIVSGQTKNLAMQSGMRKGEIHHYFEKQRSYDSVRACIREWRVAQARKISN